MLKAKDLSRKAIKLGPANTLLDARNSMLRYNISRVVIAETDKAVGIITEKDIARFLYKDSQRRRLEEVKIDQVMTKRLVAVDEESDLKTSANLMLEYGISSLIVVDSKDFLKGIFTKSDLAKAYSLHYTARHNVEEYMTKNVITVAPDDTSFAALSIITDNKVSRVVVIENKKPIGVITPYDFLQASPYFAQHLYRLERKPEERGLHMDSGIRKVLLARDLIRVEPITVLKDSDLADAAQIMTNNGISGLPVVDSNYELAGIVSKTDIVRALREC